ncbi:hypothetical protein Nepgr_018570 [Nepenthes gracilis]|uniref:TITAN-like protein n=1 Tax=Nepenthes gracilis TaxID=150966 RepID=A0AAD3STT5_NEPGR|nr:hypothetical protein Nepgr_018570 [Nepenthes gracilis]
MADQAPARSNPNLAANWKSSRGKKEEEKKKVKKKDEFEFCQVCRINHEQGRRHNYFPSHANALSLLFSRFHKKVVDARFFLKNPNFIHPEHAAHNRFWCVFCDCDVDELGSTFASGNAIEHLASGDHLKNLKHFLWKYGGGMDRVDSFRITEADLAKWEKRCEVLTHETAISGEGSSGPLHRPPNDIQPDCVVAKNNDKNNINFLESSFWNDVIPLQYSTNENYQVYHEEMSPVANFGPLLLAVAPPLSSEMLSDPNTLKSNDMTAYRSNQDSHHSDSRNISSDGCISGKSAYKNKRMAGGDSGSQGFQNLTCISWGFEESKRNVHSGAPPPWFEATKDANESCQWDRVGMNSVVSRPSKSQKSSKLNPKRVGAAWAERRKIELEMEKKGEVIANSSEVEWLPNFGRVWQSGSRKESRKEFEKEKHKLPKDEAPSQTVIKMQPYVSKRMKRDAKEGSSGGHTEEH